MKINWYNHYMKILPLLFLLFLSSCRVSEEESKRVLVNSGYTQIELKGVALFSCSDDDGFSRKFTAINPRGERVDGTICCGLLKSCTVRF